MLYKKGRGAQINTHNKFEKHSYQTEREYLEFLHVNGDDTTGERKTQFIEVFPKTIVNPVKSPDVGMEWSMNPYQGCEHGCTYCYARNSHEYWGYSAGSEFEQVILVKKNAPRLLTQFLQKPSWQPQAIVLSGNTDCYQPAEKQFGITRELLKVLLKYRNPVGIITKNALIQRDIDILKELNEHGLIKVSLSITSLQEDLRRKLEPRTATVKRRLQTLEQLAKYSIPINVMMAPIIPGLNSHEILPLAQAVSEAGAQALNYTTVRLNGQIADIFMDWLAHHFPDRADKVKHQIEELHGGQLNDSEFGRRMRGSGEIATQIKSLFSLARKKYGLQNKLPDYNYEAFIKAPKGQISLF